MKKLLYLIITVVCCVSCDDYLDITPVGQVIPNSVDEYRSFLTSAYSIAPINKALTTYRSDELKLSSTAPGVEQYKDIFIWNDTNPNPLTVDFPYGSFYNIIFYCNHIINSKETIKGEKDAIDQLLAEAHALRALQYFELINLYGKPYNAATTNTDAGVPITLSYEADKQYPISSVGDVYKLILEDLNQAEELINISKQPLGYNYRFSDISVKAFKARVYLYQQDWKMAAQYANAVLQMQPELQDLNNNVANMPSEFNSVESILALQIVATFDLVNNGRISDDLNSAYNSSEDLRYNLYFEINKDGIRSKKREDNKFKVSFRTSEMYLIAAEAQAHLQNAALAKEALYNLAENRYTSQGFITYKTNIDSLNTDDLLSAILEERRREFVLEGHRWNDLRRSGQPAINKTFDGTIYTLEKNDNRYVIPFPKDAIINNPDL